jgi:carboxypeptidase Q
MAQEASGSIATRYRDPANRLIQAALADTTAYRRLEFLADRIGNRPSGSEPLERAIDWVLTMMKSDGLSQVRGERVMVPHWVRGAESAELIAPRALPLHLLGPRRQHWHTEQRHYGPLCWWSRASTS